MGRNPAVWPCDSMGGIFIKTCPGCGAPLEGKKDFCSVCGLSLKGARFARVLTQPDLAFAKRRGSLPSGKTASALLAAFICAGLFAAAAVSSFSGRPSGESSVPANFAKGGTESTAELFLPPVPSTPVRETPFLFLTDTGDSQTLWYSLPEYPEPLYGASFSNLDFTVFSTFSKQSPDGKTLYYFARESNSDNLNLYQLSLSIHYGDNSSYRRLIQSNVDRFSLKISRDSRFITFLQEDKLYFMGSADKGPLLLDQGLVSDTYYLTGDNRVIYGMPGETISCSLEDRAQRGRALLSPGPREAVRRTVSSITFKSSTAPPLWSGTAFSMFSIPMAAETFTTSGIWRNPKPGSYVIRRMVRIGLSTGKSLPPA